MRIKGWRKVNDTRIKSNNSLIDKSGGRLNVQWNHQNNKMFVGNMTKASEVVYYFKPLKGDYKLFMTEIAARKGAVSWMRKHPRG